VVEIAIERGTGARALRSVLENVMIDIMFELPTLKDVQKCIITSETIDKISGPVYEKKDGKERLTA